MAFPIDFTIVNRAASAICAALFLAFLFKPQIIWWLFAITDNPEIDFLARRTAMLFLGLAVLTWKTALIEDCQARRAVSAALAITMAGLATVGLTEFARGFAGPGILLAVAMEATFLMLYVRQWRYPAAI